MPSSFPHPQGVFLLENKIVQLNINKSMQTRENVKWTKWLYNTVTIHIFCINILVKK